MMIARLQHPRLIAFMSIFALGLAFLAIGVGSGTSKPALDAARCGGQDLAGVWLNKDKPESHDLMTASIRIPCTGAKVEAGLVSSIERPRIDVQLTMRCLHWLACEWQTTTAEWKAPEHPGGNPLLTMELDQERFERTVTIEPIDGGKLRLTLKSRFKGLVVAPVQTVYLLERAKV